MSCSLFSTAHFDTVPTASIRIVSFLEQLFSMFLLAGGTEEGIRVEKEINQDRHEVRYN
jgi:hypothetical protein